MYVVSALNSLTLLIPLRKALRSDLVIVSSMVCSIVLTSQFLSLEFIKGFQVAAEDASVVNTALFTFRYN